MNGPSLTSSTAISAPKRPVSTPIARGPQTRDEPVEERNGKLGSGRIGEAGTPPASQVGEERELADHQQRAAGVADGEVRAPIGVPEVAQADQLVGHAIDHLRRVVDADPGEHERAAADLSQQLVAGAHRRAGHALNDEAHRLGRSGRLGALTAPRAPSPRIDRPGVLALARRPERGFGEDGARVPDHPALRVVVGGGLHLRRHLGGGVRRGTSRSRSPGSRAG